MPPLGSCERYYIFAFTVYTLPNSWHMYTDLDRYTDTYFPTLLTVTRSSFCRGFAPCFSTKWWKSWRWPYLAARRMQLKALLCRCGEQETRKLLNLLIAIVFRHSRSVCDKKNSGKYVDLSSSAVHTAAQVHANTVMQNNVCLLKDTHKRLGFGERSMHKCTEWLTPIQLVFSHYLVVCAVIGSPEPSPPRSGCASQ